jgi:hypothetical protein
LIKHVQIAVVFATKYSVGRWVGICNKKLTNGNLKLQVICEVVYQITHYNYLQSFSNNVVSVLCMILNVMHNFKRRAYLVRHIELLCIYAYFKFGLSNAQSTVPHFFINESSDLVYDIARQMIGWWEGLSVKKRDTIG